MTALQLTSWLNMKITHSSAWLQARLSQTSPAITNRFKLIKISYFLRVFVGIFILTEERNPTRWWKWKSKFFFLGILWYLVSCSCHCTSYLDYITKPCPVFWICFIVYAIAANLSTLYTSWRRWGSFARKTFCRFVTNLIR